MPAGLWRVLIHQQGKKKTLSIFAGKRSLQEKERPHYGNGMFYAGDILESGTVNKEAKKG